MLLPDSFMFVDAARYADIARNFLEAGQFRTHFNFPSSALPNEYGWLHNLPPVPIVILSFFFQLFGVSDFSAILASLTFFLMGAPLVFLIAQRVFGRTTAIFSTLFYLFTPQLFNYAKDGASEPVFIFELLFISYFLILGKHWSMLLAGIVTGLSFFTKLQSYLFAPIFLLWVLLLYRQEIKKIGIFLMSTIGVIFLNVIGLLFGSHFLEMPTYLALQQTALYPGDNLPRSGMATSMDIQQIIKNISVLFTKFSYNLYNFYKSVFTFDNLLPSWASPLVVVTYLLSFINFLTKETNEKRIFRIIVAIMVLGSFFLAGATSPSFRYLHFVLPFVVIIAVDFIIQVFQNFKLSERKIQLIMLTTFMVFLVIPFLGTNILDSRFSAENFNTEKPHIQKVLGEKVGELTDNNEITVTNLDTWGSWYGKRKTMLIPLDLVGLEKLDKTVKINAIFLTDFQRGNGDHPITGDWGVLFDNTQDVNNRFILENFRLERTATISAQEVYEGRPFTYKLWLRTK